jgi:D-sedoheptulose 7-phosphate isomerase
MIKQQGLGLVEQYIAQLKNTLDLLNHRDIEEVANAFLAARNKNKQILVFGNGGSGSTASHMVCDILKGCSYGKAKRFKILCLNDSIPTVLAYGNDVGYDMIFLEQLKNYMQPGDVVLGISGSGNSKNIINALEYANANSGITIGFTGFNGGKLKSISSICLNANINDMQISEDIHLIVLHILYKILQQ